MRFASERALQDHCLQVLRSRGIPTEAEVACGNGLRADLVTKDTIYELKLTLDREALYQARGQAETYRASLRRPNLVLVGHLPTSAEKATQALKIAETFERSGIRVSFLERDPFWTAAAPTLSLGCLPAIWSIVLGSIVGLALLHNRAPEQVAIGVGGATTAAIETAKRRR